MNAIILAAGLGSRMSSFTSKSPKCLATVGGETIIERQIRFLQEIGIREIIIVTGYQANQLAFLAPKHGIKIIHNNNYEDFNNFYSLYLAKEYLKGTYIIEGDVYIVSNFFRRHLSNSTYFTGLKLKLIDEWILLVSRKNITGFLKFNSLSPAQQTLVPCPNYIMSGISYWSEVDCESIKDLLNQAIDESGVFIYTKYEHCFWDQLILDNLNRFSIHFLDVGGAQWHEIDTMDDWQTASSNLSTDNIP